MHGARSFEYKEIPFTTLSEKVFENTPRKTHRPRGRSFKNFLNLTRGKKAERIMMKRDVPRSRFSSSNVFPPTAFSFLWPFILFFVMASYLSDREDYDAKKWRYETTSWNVITNSTAIPQRHSGYCFKTGQGSEIERISQQSLRAVPFFPHHCSNTHTHKRTNLTWFWYLLSYLWFFLIEGIILLSKWIEAKTNRDN